MIKTEIQYKKGELYRGKCIKWLKENLRTNDDYILPRAKENYKIKIEIREVKN